MNTNISKEEEDFLKNYRIEDYERPSVTVDIASFSVRQQEVDNYRQDDEKNLCILLVKRGQYPYKDYWALPGGFLKKGESVEDCAFREIEEETHVKPVSLMSIGSFSADGRDPRGWIISNAFVSVISESSVKAIGGDDASDAKWFRVNFAKDGDDSVLELRSGDIYIKSILKETNCRFGRSEFEIKDRGNLAFDHASIISTALTVLRSCGENFDFLFDFLPAKFTLTDLQRVQETILNVSILPANFRRKISGYVEETDESTSGAGHRPAKLFTRKK